MGMFTTINTAATGLTAQRTRLDVIADNIANVNTTRTDAGGAFRRKRVVFSSRAENPYWRGPFVPDYLDNGVGRGVRIVSIEEDLDSEPRMVYDPEHPDAILTGRWAGYVAYPNVNIVNEMVDMIAASRSYEANAAVIDGSKSMFTKALQIAS